MGKTQSVRSLSAHSKLDTFSLGFEENRSIYEERQRVKARTHQTN